MYPHQIKKIAKGHEGHDHDHDSLIKEDACIQAMNLKISNCPSCVSQPTADTRKHIGNSRPGKVTAFTEMSLSWPSSLAKWQMALYYLVHFLCLSLFFKFQPRKPIQLSYFYHFKPTGRPNQPPIMGFYITKHPLPFSASNKLYK